MAKQPIVMNPPAVLERRETDIPLTPQRFLPPSLFAPRAKKPSLEKFPGTLALRGVGPGQGNSPHWGRGLGALLPPPLRRPRPAADRTPRYLPIDAPTDVEYASRRATLCEGDLFGEVSCLYGTPRSATIVASRDCYMVEMLRNIVDQLLGDKKYREKMG